MNGKPDFMSRLHLIKRMYTGIEKWRTEVSALRDPGTVIGVDKVPAGTSYLVYVSMKPARGFSGMRYSSPLQMLKIDLCCFSDEGE